MEEKKSHIFLKFIIFCVFIFLCIFFYAKYVGVNGLIVKEYRVKSNILSSNFNGLKIVHFSDLLYKSTIDNDDVMEIVDKINILKPDIVIFSGDLVLKGEVLIVEDTQFLISSLSSISASIGKYAVYGDFDYSNKEYDRIMNDSSFVLLSNSYDQVYFNDSRELYIVGLSSSLKENIDLDKSFEFYKDENRPYIIVVVHEGASIKYLDESTYEVDLILGGHSLNGSVVFPYVGGLFKDSANYKYMGEYFSKGITQIYMSSGLGTSKYKYRLFNKPSINLYRLKAQS